MMKQSLIPVLAVFLVGAAVTGCEDGDISPYQETIQAHELGVLSIEITPNNQVMNSGETLQLNAVGKKANSTTVALNDKVRWRSSDASIASVNALGLVTSHRDGEVTMTANFGTFNHTVTVRVNTSVLQSITIDNVAVVNECQNIGLTATGQYEDGTQRTITDKVSWSTVTTGLGSFDAATAGLLKTTNAGVLAVAAQLGGVRAEQTVTVQDGITSIALSSSAVTLAQKSTMQYTATASYSDNTSAAVTGNAIWTANPANLITFSTVTPGLATGVTIGTTTVSATCGGAVGSAGLSVTPEATLQSVEINGGDSEKTLNVGNDTNLTLTAKFSDGSTKTVTQDAEWVEVSDPNNAVTLDNSSGDKGEVTATAVGEALIKATYDSKESLIRIIVQ